MTVMGLNNDECRECKFRFNSTVISLYLKRETYSLDCMKVKVRSQPEMFAISHLVSSWRTWHSSASQEPPLSLLLACLGGRK